MNENQFFVPPPWRQTADGKYYNEVTKEVSNVHPMRRILEARGAQTIEPMSPSPDKNTRSLGRDMSRVMYDRGESGEFLESPRKLGSKFSVAAPIVESTEETQLARMRLMNRSFHGSPLPPCSLSARESARSPSPTESKSRGNSRGGSRGRISPVPVVSRANGTIATDVDERSRVEEFSDFKCTWQERGLKGNTLTFHLIIRLFTSDLSCLIRIEGVDGEWRYTMLTGPYGPLQRIDFFIGAKIQVFGRKLYISTANLAAVQWIENQGVKMRNRIDFLQGKVESVGCTPVVRRKPPTVIAHVARPDSPLGSVNLRRLHIEISKLCEQLSSLGLSHFALQAKST